MIVTNFAAMMDTMINNLISRGTVPTDMEKMRPQVLIPTEDAKSETPFCELSTDSAYTEHQG